MKNPQQSKNKKLQHLLSIKGLDKKIIEQIFNDADKFLEKKDIKLDGYKSLNGKTVCNLFFENSTRGLRLHLKLLQKDYQQML